MFEIGHFFHVDVTFCNVVVQVLRATRFIKGDQLFYIGIVELQL